MADIRPHIGTLREKPLHASLKEWYRKPGDLVETAVDGCVIDLVRDGLLIEVQTRGFSSMKKKVGALLDRGHSLRIVHPIAVDKWIVRVDSDGTIVSRRRSPIHGSEVDIVAELVSFPERLADQRLEIEVVLINAEEYRVHTPGRSWRRDGWSVVERRLLEVVETLLLREPADLVRLLPSTLPEPFVTRELADELGRPLRTAQQMAYCLRHAGVIEMVGRQGDAVLYQQT
jgi:hypothetical protein